jgi:hypothetical protein
VDAWDGSHAQLDVGFRQGTGTTYPLLLKGSKVVALYRMSIPAYVVVDHTGIIQYRPGVFASSASTIREVVEK